jgi:hypothetical protein
LIFQKISCGRRRGGGSPAPSLPPPTRYSPVCSSSQGLEANQKFIIPAPIFYSPTSWNAFMSVSMLIDSSCTWWWLCELKRIVSVHKIVEKCNSFSVMNLLNSISIRNRVNKRKAWFRLFFQACSNLDQWKLVCLIQACRLDLSSLNHTWFQLALLSGSIAVPKQLISPLYPFKKVNSCNSKQIF